jgi:two-component system sensor histidine kinase KdpD
VSAIGWAVTSHSTGNQYTLGRWCFWLVMLSLVTAALLAVRGDIEQSHAALVLLLVVLGGSAGGGRTLGYVLAVLGFLLLDYFFQAPYGLFSVGKALDWVVLSAFVASAFVTTELLARAKEEADTARARTDEVASLSRLGSATLRHARAEDALNAAGSLIRATLGARWCSIRHMPNMGDESDWTSAALGEDDGHARRRGLLEERIIDRIALGIHEGEVVLAAPGGGVSVEVLENHGGSDHVEAIGLPLHADSRLVGILIVGGDSSTPIVFDAARRRFMGTIRYYAALGVERVRLEREARQARDLREANRLKDEVLATVSHDLRTPLTSIKLLAQASAVRGDPAAATIEQQADRLSRMVSNVLDLSTIRSGTVRLEMELNTAEDVIAAAIAQAQGGLNGRRLHASVDLDEPELVARFDFVQTLRILGNLIDNALRYSPECAVVHVTAAREEPWIAMRVIDTGPGVPEEERDRIFEAFYRPKRQAPDGGSSGLGLSIAQRLAELQDGMVCYEPRPGGGSIFTVRLPAVDVDPALMADA